MSDHSRQRWKQIEALFCSALDLRPEERAALVALEADDDEELKREVEALLEQHLLAADYLETPAAASFYKRAEKDSSARMIGRRVGAYRLVKEIGRGGMGSVFLAERADGEYRQRVAVKIVRPEMDTEFSPAPLSPRAADTGRARPPEHRRGCSTEARPKTGFPTSSWST